MSRRRLLVLADDLSGAADCGIAFTRAGLSAVVLLADNATATADVLALDADSRHRPPDEAASIHAGLLQRHFDAATLLYKKIDSTLRGNVAAELAATIKLAGVAIVAPAFPDTGRTTRDGRVYVNGVPLEATEIWQREHMPGVADIAAMLACHEVRAARAGLPLVRGGEAAFGQALDDMEAAGAQAIVCDAETPADLAAIAAASAHMRRPRFWAGSAGLAHHLPRAFGIGGNAPTPAAIAPRGPVLVAVGSLSGISRAQADLLAAQAGVVAITVAPEALHHGASHARWQASAAALWAAIERGDDVVLTIASDAAPDLRDGLALCHMLGRLVLPVADRLGALVATGGDTARGLLTAFGAAGLRLSREIEPGVVLSTTEGSRLLPMVTKAGAFGTPQTLVHCRAVLRGLANLPPG